MTSLHRPAVAIEQRRPATRRLAALGALVALMATAPGTAATAPGPAERATAAAIARIHALDGRIGAVIAIAPEAMAQARALDRAPGGHGALFGLPILVKDNVETAGALPTTAGSLALRANVSGKDAPLVARLRAAGAVILGKTNLSEWANIRSTASISGWSAVGGQTRNPWALDRNPCGSSSGSGAAVAAGLVSAAIGTETDGSITCPASVNGIVGLKPTVGLVSRARVVPISASQDTAGPMAADVRTAARVLAAIAGSDPADPATAGADAHRADYVAVLSPGALRGVRIGVLRFAGPWGQPVSALFERTLATLRAAGAVLVEVKDGPDQKAIGTAENKVLMSEFRAGIDAYLAATPAAVPVRSLADLIAFDRTHAAHEMPLFGQETFEEAAKAPALTDAAYRDARALARRLAGADGIDRLLAADHLDLLVAPTMAPAWKIDAVNGDITGAGGAGGLAAVAGYPHLTVPMGLVRGLPVGLSFIGPAWSEARLLACGYDFERLRGPLPKPTFTPSIETEPATRALLLPQ